MISNFKFQISNSEKGVSLIITFFILVIIIAIVLFLSTISYNEIKIIRNIGKSVVSFYGAESGTEKILYYDRRVVPENAKRGICNMCNACPQGTSSEQALNCQDCAFSGNDCGITSCHECTISFDTALGSEGGDYGYTAEAKILPGGSSDYFNFDVIGSYNGVKRAIEIYGEKK